MNRKELLAGIQHHLDIEIKDTHEMLLRARFRECRLDLINDTKDNIMHTPFDGWKAVRIYSITRNSNDDIVVFERIKP